MRMKNQKARSARAKNSKMATLGVKSLRGVESRAVKGGLLPAVQKLNQGASRRFMDYTDDSCM